MFENFYNKILQKVQPTPFSLKKNVRLNHMYLSRLSKRFWQSRVNFCFRSTAAGEYLECGPWTWITGILWDLPRNVQSQNSRHSQSNLDFNQISKWFIRTLKFEKRWSNRKVNNLADPSSTFHSFIKFKNTFIKSYYFPGTILNAGDIATMKINF